ncbi:MAG TPA: adenylate/guanylate cyclase domain-containing protein [Candidatus Limnocylindrales bacterium]
MARRAWVDAVRDASGRLTGAPAPGESDGTNGIALVVDDSVVNRKLLAQLLAGLGMRTIEATQGADALAILAADTDRSIDVVLLDVVMPELDGYATLETIKADEALRHLPVIMISGVDELDSVVRCIEMGAADYLPKPFNPAVLRARINASLAAKRLRDLERDYLVRQTSLTETIERQKEQLSRFLSPQIAALVSSRDGEQLLAGHRRQITAMFADLRGFTAFAQEAEPEELLGVLGEYHRMMGEKIVEHGGTLEHFAGDGMLVFFNDPVPQPDHVERAVAMAVAMRTEFGRLAAGWRKRGYNLNIGIGIATGYATLGRIGFEGRHDYGAIGNVVILASRLSSEAKADQILLSQRTHAAVEDLVEAESVGDLTLKGFSRPVPALNVNWLRSDPRADAPSDAAPGEAEVSVASASSGRS